MSSSQRSSGRDFEALFHQAPAGYLVTAPDGTILDVNETFLTCTGLSRSAVEGACLLSLLPPGDRLMYASHALPQLETHGGYAELAVDITGDGGTRVPVLMSAARSAPAPGEAAVDRIIVFSASQRRSYEHELEAALRQAEDAENARMAAETASTAHRAELARKDEDLRAALQQTRRNESLLRTILHTVDVGIAVVDRTGTPVLMNHQYRQSLQHAAPGNPAEGSEAYLLAYGPEEGSYIPAGDIPRERAARGEAFSEELIWVGPPGNQRVLSVSARPVTDLDDFTGSVIAYGDVTRLVNAVRAQEDFVANVSHELRTPLTSIIGYLDLVLDEHDLPAAVAGPLNVAVRNSERLLQLVNDLLSTAAAGNGVDPRPVDLAPLISASIGSAALRAKTHHVQLSADLPSTLPALVDPQRIGRVLDNLLSNAIKFSPDGGHVRVTARLEDQHIVVEVADTGMGMTEHERQEAFTKFFRAGSALKAAIPGAGLGLAITRNIVEAHNGTITLRSEPGRGTTATVTLPRRN